MLGLAKFKEKVEVGTIVESPYWGVLPVRGSGIFVLQKAQGDYNNLKGQYWAVLEYETSADNFVLFKDRVEIYRGKVVYYSDDPSGLINFFKDEQFDENSAFSWAKLIGNREYMKNFISSDSFALQWAKEIGDADHMIKFIKTPEFAMEWILRINREDRFALKHIIAKSSKYSRIYGEIYRREADDMIDYVTDEDDAFMWAARIGNKDVMRQRIKSDIAKYWWKDWFHEDLSQST